MARIRRLSVDVANQIAAGEVVERPASVIKELIENSIDADARRIAITIELGGKKLIRVEDDGFGMDPDDARLAVERHATSKIVQAADLEQIATLGFRGEALPSIASVSHFTLRTRARGADSGTVIRIDGGVVASISEAGVPTGTSIEVADLFYNLPARRKFLKADGAEAAQVSRIVTQMALCYPEIGFTLNGSGRRVLQCPPVGSLRDRLYQLYGDRSDLVEVRRDGDVRIVGFIAALAGVPGTEGPTRGPQNIFINRRIVKDGTIQHAIIDVQRAKLGGYQSLEPQCAHGEAPVRSCTTVAGRALPTRHGCSSLGGPAHFARAALTSGADCRGTGFASFMSILAQRYQLAMVRYGAQHFPILCTRSVDGRRRVR